MQIAHHPGLQFLLSPAGLQANLQLRLFQGRVNLLAGAEVVEETLATSTQTPAGAADRRSFTAEVSSGAGSLQVRGALDVLRDQPGVCLTTSLTNTGNADMVLDRLELPWLVLDDVQRPLWSVQGAAVGWGQDFAFPLPDEYERENFLGHVDGGEGGGGPVGGVWNRAAGLALMHIEPQPVQWSLPVSSREGRVAMSLAYCASLILHPGERFVAPRALVYFHNGDFFAPLDVYRQMMAAQGLVPAPTHPEDFAPAWCSWGYEFDVTAAEVLGAMPAVQELNIHWVTLDDRWFDNYGDWQPRADTFPGGGAEMRAMVDRIHAAGGLAQIWWYPLAVEDGVGEYSSHVYATANLLNEHPDWLILNPDGSPARNNRGLAILDPSLPAVQQYIAETTRRFVVDWDFDGHKLDNIYTVPPCYNPAHNHTRPQESVEALSTVYRIIYETTRELKPWSVNQICPCGTPITFSLLPWMDQAVTADPTSSAQVRQRIKFYKALLGLRAAVFADHVELSDGAVDFASGMGAGGVPATKFVHPVSEQVHARVEDWQPYTPEKRELYLRWFGLYAETRLAQEEYLNLYDLAFDAPEAHAIRKGDEMYYAFFAGGLHEVFNGEIELRGLHPTSSYEVCDYVENRSLGRLDAGDNRMRVNFTGSLLLRARPAQQP